MSLVLRQSVGLNRPSSFCNHLLSTDNIYSGLESADRRMPDVHHFCTPARK